MCICNDRRWPETYRVMGLQGVELVMLGYNTHPRMPEGGGRPGETPVFTTPLGTGRADQNATFVVATAKCGVEDGHPCSRKLHRQSGGEIIAAAKTEVTS